MEMPVYEILASRCISGGRKNKGFQDSSGCFIREYVSSGREREGGSEKGGGICGLCVSIVRCAMVGAERTAAGDIFCALWSRVVFVKLQCLNSEWSLSTCSIAFREMANTDTDIL